MIEYTVFCDVCGDLLDGSHISAAEARRLAKAAGRLRRSRNKDLCNQCNPPEKSEATDKQALRDVRRWMKRREGD